MQKPIIQQCSNCNSIKELYSKLQCTVLFLVKNKYNNRRFNTNLYTNRELSQDLKVYERVLRKRMFNSGYPSSSIENQDIIGRVTSIVHEKECSFCTSCFPELETTTTTLAEESTTTTIL
jgi:hypothetical protein